MTNIIVVLPRLDDAKNIKNVLVRNGIRVTGICSTGAQAVSQADGLHDGIVICSYKMPDMLYSELHEYLPPGFEMLLMASQNLINECYGNDIVCLTMPLKVNDLINTVGMMSEDIERRRRRNKLRPKVRSAEEEAAIREAKEVKGKPSVILLHTVKGAGIRYYEEMANCHSTEVKKDNLPDFYQELDKRLKEKEEA